MSIPLSLHGKNALITGGSRGIGRAIVKTFAQAGAQVAFTYRSSAQAAEELVAELTEAGHTVKAYQADAADYEAANKVVQSILDAWQTLDILVNNAGITRDGLLLRLSEADWDAVMETNLKGVFNFCKAVYRPMMRQRSGKIINMSSIVGVIGNAGQTNYAASKAGIIGFTKSLAKELGARGICVNAIAPGYVETEMTAQLPEKARETLEQAIPLRRTAQPEEIAHATLFLASPLSDYITGHVLHVDGGLAM